jgi:hypothetical protein
VDCRCLDEDGEDGEDSEDVRVACVVPGLSITDEPLDAAIDRLCGRIVARYRLLEDGRATCTKSRPAHTSG